MYAIYANALLILCPFAFCFLLGWRVWLCLYLCCMLSVYQTRHFVITARKYTRTQFTKNTHARVHTETRSGRFAEDELLLLSRLFICRWSFPFPRENTNHESRKLLIRASQRQLPGKGETRRGEIFMLYDAVPKHDTPYPGHRVPVFLFPIATWLSSLIFAQRSR